MPPSVSVIVPSYNYARFLPERIESVLAQTRDDFELLLLDDASTDGSQDVLRAYADRPGVRLVLGERNSGNPFRQWNRGVALASAPYVWIAEADDAAAPELLERLLAVLERHPRVGLVHCGFERIDEQGHELADPQAWWREIDPLRWTRDFVDAGRGELAYLRQRNVIGNASGVVFRRELYCSLGGADDSYRLAGDWDLWVRMLAQSDVGFVAAPLNRWRWHMGSVRQRSLPDDVETREARRVLARLASLTGEDAKALLVEYHCRRAEGWLRGAVPGRAAREAWAALGEVPLAGRAWRALGAAGLQPVRRPLGRAWRRLRGGHR